MDNSAKDNRPDFDTAYNSLSEHFKSKLRSSLGMNSKERDWYGERNSLLHELSKRLHVSDQSVRMRLKAAYLDTADGTAYFLPTHSSGSGAEELRRTAVLLDCLSISERDPFVQHMKKVYPDFSYPPQSLAATEFSGADYGDPLEYIREVSKQLGFSWSGAEVHTEEPSGRPFFRVSKGANSVNPEYGTHDEHIEIDFLYLGNEDGLARFVGSRKRANFNPLTGVMDDLGDHKNKIEIGIRYSNRRMPKEKEGFNNISLFLGANTNGNSILYVKPQFYTEFFYPGRTLLSERFRKRLPEFSDLESADRKGDFRPYIHRFLEMLTQVPRDEWHDPKIYAEGVSGGLPQTGLEAIINPVIGVLFSNGEREQLEKQIGEAQLKMRKGWMSIPRLNLGTIQLPEPGMKSLEKDEFVTSAAPYLVEYLHKLGVMSREQA